MKKNFKAILNFFIYYPLMVFLCLEIAFRILGYQNFRNDNYSVQAMPENAYVGHPKLGIQLNPGKYNITINDSLTFTTHHLENNSRYVSENIHPETPNVIFLGCSFTYGFGVDDDKNFPSILQNKHPELSIQNSGVIGYGSVQSLLQLKEIIKKKEVKLVLLNFSSLHFMRNTLSQQFRSNLKIGYARSSVNVDSQMNTSRFSYKSECEGDVKYASWKDIYTNWPGREWLASINWMQTSYDKIKENVEQQLDITACILREINMICKENDIQFGIVCLDSTPETVHLKSELNQINWLDIGLDFKDRSYTSYPFDSHPNYTGHQLIAKRIEPFLIELLNEN